MVWKAIQKCAKVITWSKVCNLSPSHFYSFCIHIIFVYTLTCICISLSPFAYMCVCTQHQEDQCGVLGCQKQLQAMNSVCLCLVLMPVGKASGCLAPPLG